MRSRQITGWLTPLAAVALVLACGPAQAPAAVCVTVTPGIDLGCRDEQGAPAGGEPTASSEPAGAPTEPEPTRRNSTVVRYDPHRVAVAFKPGVTRAADPAVISAAGGTPETAIPQIRAYLVGIEPEHRAEVLAALQAVLRGRPRAATSRRFWAAATATSAAPRPPHRSSPVWFRSS
jgi:hypothetical protein